MASYDRAIALNPDYAGAYSNRGVVLREIGRHEEALASFERALAIRPDHADALHDRGNVLMELKRPEAALASYDRALAITPGYADALNNRGNALMERAPRRGAGQLRSGAGDQARLRRGVLQPRHCAAGPGTPRRCAGQLPAGTGDPARLCRGALERRRVPTLAGDFAAGWAKFEWRWLKRGADAKRECARPLWLGEQDVAGKTVLLHAEQGFGDTIQFCRYAPLLAERGARVVLEVQPGLKSLLSGLAGVQQVVARGERLPDFDFHCPLLSLPLAFGTTLQTIPARVPYLAATPGLVQSWRAQARRQCARIGLAWSGNPKHLKDRNRSIARAG